MALSDEQIKNLLCKEIKSKTILVKPEEVEKVICEHKKEGWKLKSQSDINDRLKVTFIKTK